MTYRTREEKRFHFHSIHFKSNSSSLKAATAIYEISGFTGDKTSYSPGNDGHNTVSLYIVMAPDYKQAELAANYLHQAVIIYFFESIENLFFGCTQIPKPCQALTRNG